MAFSLITLSLALLSHRSWAVFLGARVYCLGIGMGPGVTVFAFAVELFPTDLIGSASGLAAAVARIGALLSAVGFPLMETGIHFRCARDSGGVCHCSSMGDLALPTRDQGAESGVPGNQHEALTYGSTGKRPNGAPR